MLPILSPTVVGSLVVVTASVGRAAWAADRPIRRSPSPTMGGLTGLPRVPDAALALTRSYAHRRRWLRSHLPFYLSISAHLPMSFRYNPGGGYTERIATLWRDLETLYVAKRRRRAARAPTLMTP